MQIFIYEWVCGGGFLGGDEAPPESLLDEGAAMLRAVVDDFAKLEGVTVVSMLEASLSPRFNFAGNLQQVDSKAEHDRVFDELAKQSDHTVVIAPEFRGILLGLSQRVVDVGGKLLSPGPEFVEIASDKHSTVTALHAAGVRVPKGVVVMPGEECPADFSYPAILKPIDGAGSLGVQRLEATQVAPTESGCYLLEQFISGTPASVAALCVAGKLQMMEPTLQRVDVDKDFAYLGGSLPIDEPLRERAIRLGEQAIAALPGTTGYVGVDLVLGEANDGTQDYVIEVNPRYTVSYVGLRAATDANLAECLLSASAGNPAAAPVINRDVQWVAAGAIRQL